MWELFSGAEVLNDLELRVICWMNTCLVGRLRLIKWMFDGSERGNETHAKFSHDKKRVFVVTCEIGIS